jgi:PKD repeat protein
LKSVRSLVIGLILSIAAASPVLAQNHPMPGSKSELPVLCTGCPGNNASGQANDGLPTYPYSGVLLDHVGRYVDSSSTNSFQHWAGSFRTARARTIRTAYTTRGTAPPRVYIQIGNAVAAYSLDSFFTSRLPGGMKPINYKFSGAGSGREYFLEWDSFVYPEYSGSGWQLDGGDFQDPMSKAVPFDFDDRGNVYVATEKFGWAIVTDDGKTDGNHMPKVIQFVASPDLTKFTKVLANTTRVKPEAIVSLKVGSSYYAITADRDSSAALWDATTANRPTLVTVRAGKEWAIRQMARDDGSKRFAYIDNNLGLRIFDYATYVAGGAPVAEYTADAGSFGEVLSMDEAGNIWTVESTGKVWKLAPSGSGYVKSTYTPFPDRFQPLMLSAGAGYLAIGGIDWAAGTYDVKVLRIEANGLTNQNIDNFFRKYYHQAPANYAQPGSYTAILAQSADVEIIKWGGKTYLLYSGYGLGDVFELQGGNSISVTARTGPFGVANPNAKSTESGPFYGDPVTFVASSSGNNVNYDVTWNFGNPESGARNTGTSRTGEDETHQYTGIASAATITAPKTVKAITVQDGSIQTVYNLSLKLPVPRVGGSALAVPISASTTGLDVLLGDVFNDASDGAVEGHVGVWNKDGVTTYLKPNETLPVGAIGPHTLTFSGSYGTYDASFNIQNPYQTPALSIGYVVKPFTLTMNPPTANGATVTFSATPHVTTAPGAITAANWNVVWKVNGVEKSNVTTNVGSLNQLLMAKSDLVDGTVVSLTVTIDPAGIAGGGAQYNTITLSTTLSTPDPDIAVTGCANAMSPCKFTAISTGNKSMTGWTYQWTLTRPASAGGPITGTSSTLDIPAASMSAAGTYTIALKATKTIFSIDVTKQVTLAASLCGPLPQSFNVSIVKAGCSTSCAPGTNIEFAPAFLSYAKQACDSYSWNLGDNTVATTETVSHSYTTAGTYTVTLTLSNSGTTTPLVKTTTVTITSGITDPPVTQPPANTCTAPTNITVVATCNGGATCRTSDTVAFTARRNGSALQTCDNVNWSFGDNTSSTLKAPTHTYAANGTYTVSATVSNTAGSAPAATTQVVIADPVGNCSLAPTIGNFTVDYVGPTTNCRPFNSTPCNGGEAVAFSSPNYYYVVGSCDHFEWDFGDGTPKSSDRNPTHSFPGGQTYNVKLRVYNNGGEYTYSRGVQVAGTAATKPVPVITAASFPNTGRKGTSVTFRATSSMATTTGWTWNFGDGTAINSSQAGTVADSSTITHTFATKGTFTVKVSARNSDDAATAPSGEAQGTIAITDPPAIPEYRYLLPVTAYTAGQGGSAWRTDVQIYNPDPQVSEAKPLIMDATFKGVTKQLTMIKATHIYENFLGNLLDLQKEDQGPVIITTKSATTPPQIWTRTYTQTPNGTFGQFIPAIRIDNVGGGAATGDSKYYMAGLRHDARYRTNVGFLNPNAAAINVTVTVYDAAKFKIGEFPLTLQPFQLDQFALKSKISSLPDNAPFSVKIDVPVGNWVIAYASFLDGLSNDPVYVQALPESDVASVDFKTTVLPGVGHTGQWRSDVTIFNPDPDGVMFDLQYFNSAGDKKGEALGVPLESGQFLQYGDLLKQGVLGTVEDGLGTLKVIVKDNHEKYPMTFARTYFDNGANGTYGQGIAGFSAARANVKPGQYAIIAGVRNSQDYKTNIGLVNLAATPVVATVTLLDPTTGAAVSSIPYEIQPNQSIVGNYNGWGALAQGTFKIEANGAVWAFCSIIDQQTKDPEYVPATPIILP